MAIKLLCLLFCFALIAYSQAYSRSSELRRFLQDVFNEESEAEDCTKWKDLTPSACSDRVEENSKYCEDYKDSEYLVKVLCKRSCSRCGPEVKELAPIGKCEDLLGDCARRYKAYAIKNGGENVCTLHPGFSYSYCRKHCGYCTGPLGRPSKK